MIANVVNYLNYKETSRANKARETENKRHNLVSEDQGQQSINETKRHNIAGERETNRHNVATEQETNRHNVATEDLGWSNYLVNKKQVDSNVLRNQYLNALDQERTELTRRQAKTEVQNYYTQMANEAETRASARLKNAQASHERQKENQTFWRTGGDVVGLFGNILGNLS